MSRTVIVSVSTQSQQLVAAAAAAGLLITLANVDTTQPAIPPQTIPASPYTATFSDVPAGTYIATAQAVDANGNALGSPVTSTQYAVEDLPPATVAVDIPVSISLSVQ